MKGNIVTIIKNEKLVNVDEDDLCKNDTVVVQAGDIVPADLRLTETTGLEVDEFDLTGEITPVIKKVQDNAILYKGSRILKGSGKGVVIATGEQTEYGQIIKQLWENNETYRFEFIKRSYLILVALLLPPFIILMAQSTYPVLFTLLYLFLAVVFILLQNNELFRHWLISKEVINLEHNQIQIRDTTVFEALNQVDVVCFDKTGVLTTRQMDVKNIYYADDLPNPDKGSIGNKPLRLVNIACALCNDVLLYEKLEQANAIDKALISFAKKNGVDIKEFLLQNKRVYDKPFDSENRYMACGYALKDLGVYYFAKGDPDVVLRVCDHYLSESGVQKKIDSDFWLFSNKNIASINQRGSTAIAMACASGICDTPPQKYTFLCMLELENSLQPGARETIREITEKGIRSIMLTGDRAETAKNISMQCGITKEPTGCLTGREIARMALLEVARQSDYCSVFARLLPSQKGIIIRLFQQKGHHVAMLGDGPNDAVALKVADAGMSFVKNSSPIARRLSRILINKLSDLLSLLEGASRIKKITNYFKLLKIMLLTIILLGFYLWAINSII